MYAISCFFKKPSHTDIIEHDDVDNLQKVIKNKTMADSIIVREYGSRLTLLYLASIRDSLRCLLHLLKIGANPNLESYIIAVDRQYAPLYVTIRNKNIPLTRLLILHGGIPFRAFNTEMQQHIDSTLESYLELKRLQALFDKRKNAADAAYKNNDRILSSELYDEAYETRLQIKQIWQRFYDTESISLVKDYYQEKITEQDNSIEVLMLLLSDDKYAEILHKQSGCEEPLQVESTYPSM